MDRTGKSLGTIIKFRATEDEKAALNALAKQHHVTESELIRRLIRAEKGLPLPVANVDRKAVEQLEDQLRRVGGNLNQATRAMNEGRVNYEPALAKSLSGLVEVIKAARLQLKEMLKSARRARVDVT